MAITDQGKLFESTLTTNPKAHTLGQAVPAGSLICIALAGQRSSSGLNIAAITDSKGGGAWDWKASIASTSSFCAVAWKRTTLAMSTSDTITVQWNGTPTKAWASAHAFTNASGTPTHEASNFATSSTVSVTLTVTGSDWLTFGCCNLPYEFGVTMTPINSSVSQDDNGASSSGPWCEAFSRNGTTGTTHTIGATVVTSVVWRMVAVSFPFLAAPTSPAGRGQPFLIGV